MSADILWGGATISIVLVSWGFYQLVLPKGAREWARAGLVQAFIIAFYAEMYGFPVTIYLLTRIFNLDVAGNFWDGNLWVYLTGEWWVMQASMIIGYTIVVFGVVLMIRGWREVYRATKTRQLATGGPYALIRHPQYTGIFLALFGEGVVHWPTLFSLTAFPIIVLAYVLLARKEERQMIKRFGHKYRAYQQRVRCSTQNGTIGRWFSAFTGLEGNAIHDKKDRVRRDGLKAPVTLIGPERSRENG